MKTQMKWITALVLLPLLAFAASNTLRENLLVREGLSPQTVGGNGDIVTDLIDMKGYRRAMFVINTGTLGDADAVFTTSVEDGDNSAHSDSGAVAAANLVGTASLASFTFGDDDELRTIEYKGIKRYVRLRITPTLNAGGSAAVGITVIMGGAENAPVTQQ